MARYLIKKRGMFSLDMAAFCAIGFMLLFFILTEQKPKEYLDTQVDAPAIKHYPVCSMGSGNNMKVVVTKDRLFLELPHTLRDTILLEMGKLKGADFTVEEQTKFKNIPRFGVSVAALKSLINGYTTPKDLMQQSGIPVDNTQNNELSDWLEISRKVIADGAGSNMYVEILSDKDVPYPHISLLLNNLQRHSFNKYNLLVNAYHRGAYDSWSEYQ